MKRRRLSASVSADLIRAAERAVAEGRAESVSAWVDDAMRRQVDHEEGLRALQEFISAWERKHGEISEAEMDAAERAARRRAIIIRDGSVRAPPKTASSKRQTSRRSA